MRLILPAAFALLLVPASAMAQDAIPLTITFDGNVASNPADGVVIRSYDPAVGYVTQPFTGTVPDYPYQPGDQVAFSINTYMPSQADLQSGAYDFALQADGTYKIALVGPNTTGTSSGVGVISDFTVSGPIQMTANAGQPLGGTGLAVVIDPQDYSFSLTTDSGWLYGTFDGPGYVYDPISGTLTAASSTCSPANACAVTGDGGFALAASDLTSVSAPSVPIWGEDGGLYGLFSLAFAGSWSLPGYNADGGGATQVPEPSTVLLFGAGAAFAIRRRRRRKLTA